MQIFKLNIKQLHLITQLNNHFNFFITLMNFVRKNNIQQWKEILGKNVRSG